MIRFAMVAVVSFGFGVVLMDTLHDKPKPQALAPQTPMTMPIQCDATVEYKGKNDKWIRKCYIRGMRT